MNNEVLMLGNEAIARGIIENGCRVATSYPGTPASEILSSIVSWKKKEQIEIHTQWAINEKVAFEIAYAASQAGIRSVVSMKQVGLNVASDPLMSAAYLGTKGGFIVISADDPGPHSSQTEQDTRMQAMMARLPVLDPDSPKQAKEMISIAYQLSEQFEIPVILRPTTRVCHARQNVAKNTIETITTEADFKKDPMRWAATPKFRLKLHIELEKKLEEIAEYDKTKPICFNKQAKNSSKAIVSSGVAAAHIKDILKELNLIDKICLYQVLQPYPLQKEGFTDTLLKSYDEILVIEETMPIIEMQFADKNKVKGRLTGHVSKTGELLPEHIEKIITDFLNIPNEVQIIESAPGRRPSLCTGCPHRASFYAIRKAAPKGIYTSDIGCYTLGLNLKAVDTVLCMGAAISQASGFYFAYKNNEKIPKIIASIGDSTFFHSGIPPLIDAAVQKVPIVLVILDNSTTGMTGGQPTPATGKGADGTELNAVNIKKIVQGCGIKFCMEEDPYNLKDFINLIKKAIEHSQTNMTPSVVIAKHPCRVALKTNDKYFDVEITDSCQACTYCIENFECPALVLTKEKDKVYIDKIACSGCGVCINMCPHNAIVEKEKTP